MWVLLSRADRDRRAERCGIVTEYVKILQRITSCLKVRHPSPIFLGVSQEVPGRVRSRPPLCNEPLAQREC